MVPGAWMLALRSWVASAAVWLRLFLSRLLLYSWARLLGPGHHCLILLGGPVDSGGQAAEDQRQY